MESRPWKQSKPKLLLLKLKEHPVLVSACWITLCYYLASYMRIPIVPIYARHLGASTKMIGVINSAFFFTAGLLSFPMGFLSDKFGRKVVACSGVIILSFTCFALYVAPSPLWIMIIYFFFGAGLAAYGPTMMSLVADTAPASHIGRAYGWYTTSLYLGMSVGPAIGSWVAERFGYGTVFISSGAITLCLLPAMYFLLPAKDPLALAHRFQPESKRVKLSQVLNMGLLACWIITFGGCFALGMFVTFIPLHAHDAGISVGNIGIIFFLQGLTNALSRAPFGWLSDRIGNRSWLVIGGMCSSVIALTGFALSRTLPSFLISAIFLGAGMATAFPSVGAIITEVTSPSVRGAAMGGYNAAIYFGIMSASLTMGPVIEKWGYSTAFEISSALILFLTVVFMIMIRHYQKHQMSGKTPAEFSHLI